MRQDRDRCPAGGRERLLRRPAVSESHAATRVWTQFRRNIGAATTRSLSPLYFAGLLQAKR